MRFPAGNTTNNSGNLWRTQTYYDLTTAKNGGRLNEIKVGTTDGGNNRFYRQYTYNSFGDVATLKEGSATYPFVYDNLGRLVRTEIDQVLTGKGTLVTSRVSYVDALRRRVEVDARARATT